MAGTDNSDYADKSSLSGTEVSRYAVLVLLQDASELEHAPTNLQCQVQDEVN